MPPKLRGKWALGIQPRNLTWIIKDRLAVCERPGGYGINHRRVRRQEEIIWLRENGFAQVISIIGAPHNLHSYDELNLPYLHRWATASLASWAVTSVGVASSRILRKPSPSPSASQVGNSIPSLVS